MLYTIKYVQMQHHLPRNLLAAPLCVKCMRIVLTFHDSFAEGEEEESYQYAKILSGHRQTATATVDGEECCVVTATVCH